MKSAFLDKLLAKMDRVDLDSLQVQFLNLAQERGFMETIFHAIQEGIIVLESEGNIMFANQTAERLLGFQADKALGQPLRKYIRQVEWEKLIALDPEEWSRLSRTELEIGYPEHRFLEFYIVPLERELGSDEARTGPPKEQADSAVVIFRDITNERERAADTLESERLNAIMLLAAGVAHEIGNPLNSLNIHLQLMERELDDIPKTKRGDLEELLGVARDEISRLDQIISQFLGAVRPTDPVLEKADITAVLEDTLKVVRKEVEDRGIWIEVEAESEIPVIPIDKAQIKQAFFNLIRNAMQAMNENGVLNIFLSVTDYAVSIAFKDNGSGIQPEDLSHIFEAYHTTRKKGTGLGLMIVQRILRDHGGHIEIDTEPGVGTTVTVVLPREDQRIRLLKAPRT